MKKYEDEFGIRESFPIERSRCAMAGAPKSPSAVITVSMSVSAGLTSSR